MNENGHRFTVAIMKDKRLDYCSIRNDCILVDYNDSIMY